MFFGLHSNLKTNSFLFNSQTILYFRKSFHLWNRSFITSVSRVIHKHIMSVNDYDSYIMSLKDYDSYDVGEPCHAEFRYINQLKFIRPSPLDEKAEVHERIFKLVHRLCSFLWNNKQAKTGNKTFIWWGNKLMNKLKTEFNIKFKSWNETSSESWLVNSMFSTVLMIGKIMKDMPKSVKDKPKERRGYLVKALSIAFPKSKLFWEQLSTKLGNECCPGFDTDESGCIFDKNTGDITLPDLWKDTEDRTPYNKEQRTAPERFTDYTETKYEEKKHGVLCQTWRTARKISFGHQCLDDGNCARVVKICQITGMLPFTMMGLFIQEICIGFGIELALVDEGLYVLYLSFCLCG